MIGIFAAPRWLPATIGVLAGLLAMKSVTLVRAVMMPGQSVDISFLSSNARAADKASGQKPATTPAPEAKSPAAPASPSAAQPTQAQPAQAQPAQAQPAQAQPAQVQASQAEPPMTQGERTILLELRQRRQELEGREAALVEREAVISAAQEKLAARVEELRGLQQRLEALDTDRRKQDDTSWQGLVKLYETMKPREAATIFNDLAMPVLVPVMDRMKDAKAAAILAAMDPDKARLITQALAKLRSHADVETRPAATPRQAPASSQSTDQPTGQPASPPPARPRQPNS